MLHLKKITTILCLLLSALALNLMNTAPSAAQFAPGTIIVIQDTIPDGEPVFNFNLSGGTVPTSFSLDDNAASANIPNTTSINNLPTAVTGTSYTLSQTAEAGFVTTVACVDPTGNTTVSGASATILLNFGETVTCTFTSVTSANIVVVQDTDPDAAQNFSFSIDGGLSPANFQLDDDSNGNLSNTRTFNDVEAGRYTLSQSSVNGYNTSISCAGGTIFINSGNTVIFDLEAGETITCTFTSIPLGTIVIVNDTVPNNQQDFDFTTTGGLIPITFQLDDDTNNTLPDSQTFDNVLPGNYTVSERPQAGYTTTLTCDDPSGGTTTVDSTANIDLASGETVTCTFTNRQLPGSLTIIKEANPEDGTDFAFTSSIPAGFVFGNLSTVAGNGSSGFSGNGGPATSASLDLPTGVAVDSAGNLFIVDSANQRIRKVDGLTGIITTVAGNGSSGFAGDGGPATSASLRDPYSVAVDSAGNLFIADVFNQRIRKVDGLTGIITTVAGNGSSGFAGDGGPATSARLRNPTGVAVDSAGNLFIADLLNNRIRKVDGVTGIITTVAGNGSRDFSGDGGPATNASLNTPYGVTVDSAGNLFIADNSNNRIRKVDGVTGIITTVAGNGSAGFAGDDGAATSASLNFPYDVAVDSAGNIFIADYFNGRIRKVDGVTGIITTVAGNGSSLSFPTGVEVDSAGNLFIADFFSNRIRKVEALVENASFSLDDEPNQTDSIEQSITFNDLSPGDYDITETLPSNWQLDSATCTGGSDNGNLNGETLSVAVGAGEDVVCTFENSQQTGSLIIVKEADPEDGTDFEFTASGPSISSIPTFQLKWGSKGSGDGQFNLPTGLWIDSSGHVYIADRSNHRIQKFDGDGNFISQFGSNGSGDGQFSFPSSVAVDSNGHIYVVDLDNTRIQKFDSDGTFLLKWGSSGSGDGQFDGPIDVAIDGNNHVYVVDTDKNRIQKFDSDGTFLLKWGSNGDGQGQFEEPEGVAVDGNGRVYVADTDNHHIQVFDSDGNFLFEWGSDGTNDGQFRFPARVAIDSNNHVYVTDRLNYRIQVFDSDGNFLFKWGSNGTGDGQFSNSLSGVGVNGTGDVYVVDRGNHRIQKFSHNDAFSLDDATPDDADGILQTITFNDLTPGTYAITETLPIDWQLNSATCTGGNDNGSLSGETLSVAIGAGENVTCTFSNKPACPAFPLTAADEAELNFAIGCYNDLTVTGGYTISVAADINLTASTAPINNATPDVTLLIDGNNYSIDGANSYRLFKVDESTVTFETITLQNGSAPDGGGVFIEDGQVTVSNSTLTSNSANNSGGGIIIEDGQLTISNSTLSDNSADFGGGIITEGGETTINNSTLSGNSANYSGGGIYDDGSGMTISNSTLANNPARRGGGIFSEGRETTISNSTLAGNQATKAGGGMYIDSGQVTISNSTLSDNSGASDGGGIFTVSSETTISNTIIANSPSGGDCVDISGGTFSADATNLDSDGSCDQATTSTNINLGPLQNNGGPTETQALLSGSDAIDAGDNAICAASPVNGLDQRGVARPQGASCDIGAFEFDDFGSLTLVKEADPSDGTDFAFTSDIPGGANFTLDDEANQTDSISQSITFASLVSDTYQITETLPSDWQLDSAICLGGNDLGSLTEDTLTVALEAGETIVCTFSNSFTPPTGSLTLIKEATPADGTDFLFSASGPGFSIVPTFETKWGANGSGNGQFNLPGDVAVDQNGNVYVADTFNNRIQKFDSNGGYITQWGGSGSGNGQFNSPSGVAVDANGNVYVADTVNDRVQKFDSDGGYITQWGTIGSGNGEFDKLQGIALDSSGNVYVVDHFNHRVQKFDSDGLYLTQWGTQGSGNDEFSYPRGIAVDSKGRVYVTDTSNDRVQKFDSDGLYLTQWGTTGNGNGEFNDPLGIDVDRQGNVYVGDTINNNVQIFDSNGSYLAQWGSTGSSDSEFDVLSDLAIDDRGDIYVADRNNHRIQKFAPNGVFSLDDEPNQPNDDVAQSITFANLTSGSYIITEELLSGWQLEEASCTGFSGDSSVRGNTLSVEVQAGEDVICTFTNVEESPTTGSLTIVKEATPADGTDFTFTSDIPGGASFTLDDEASQTDSISQSITFAGLVSDTYQITETLPVDWQLDSAICLGGNDLGSLTGDTLTVALEADQTIVCTFSNSFTPPTGSLTIIKEASPEDGTDFTFSSDIPGGETFTLDDELNQTDTVSQTITFDNLATGTYAITETLPTDWQLDNASCTGGNDLGSLSNETLSVAIGAGENVLCTFTNSFTTPTEINGLVELDSVQTNYNPTSAPNAPAGIYTIAGTFRNISTTTLTDLHFEVVTLTNGNLLLNADGGPAGPGAILSVPPASLGADEVLSPNETFTIEFEIGLASASAFDFFVDAYGVVVDGVTTVSTAVSDSFHFAIDGNELQSNDNYQYYMPIIIK